MNVFVFTSSTIDIDIEDLWIIIKDFNGLPSWYPGVIDSYIEGGGSTNEVGSIRNFNRSDGLSFKEELVRFDDKEHLFSYSLLSPTEPMVNYISTLRLLPITDGNMSYIEWTATFECLAEEEIALSSSLEKVFQVGFDALKKKTNNDVETDNESI